MSLSKNIQGGFINRAHIWQIAFFALNNTSTNCYLLLLNLVSYYTFGKAGLMMSILLNISTVMRIFDGFTDPLIGTLIDKADTKIGKYRPFIWIGQVIMIISVVCLYTLVNKISIKFLAYLAFVFLYALYIIGYTCQTAVTKAGQTVLTSDPKQRPTFTFFDSLYNAILFSSFGIVMPLLAKKYNGITNQDMFIAMIKIYIPLSLIFAIFSTIGIWSKDNSNYYIKNEVPVKFRDFIPVLKHNQGIKMLVLSAATDKLATTIAGNTLITTLLFAVILGDYSIFSKLSIPITIATIAAVFLGVLIARKSGQKKALVYTTIASVFSTVLFMIIMFMINPKGEGFRLASTSGVIFILGYILFKIGMSVTGGIVIPMIADCSDYETYLSGKSIPGLMATLFSFVDKLISSLATSLLSIMFIWALGKGGTIDTNTNYSNDLFIVFIIASIIIPLLGWIVTLVAMKFYPLDKEKMEEVQCKLIEIRGKQNSIDEENLIIENIKGDYNG